MRGRTLIVFFAAMLACACALQAHGGEEGVHRSLSDALVCKGTPAEAVYKLVQHGSDFKAGYAAHGFGEGTSLRAVVILREPLQISAAKTFAVISETENSNADFRGFTYAEFEGDYLSVVKLLNLQEAKPFTETSPGKFVSQQPPKSQCPPIITLTPLDKKHFLLGCGWCNGG